MSNLPLLLGEAPGDKRPGDAVAYPLRSLAPRLAAWAGFPVDGSLPEPQRSYAALRERFDCMNVFERREDAYPWSVKRAREAWTRYLLCDSPPGDLVLVCLGRRAADAVGTSWPWFEWFEVGLLNVVTIPHPSGRCRQYNDPAAREAAGRVLREAIDRVRDVLPA